MSHKYSLSSRNHHEMPCELCKQHGTKVERLNPRNWQPEERRLCRKHMIELGYHPIDYTRGGYAGGKLPGDT